MDIDVLHIHLQMNLMVIHMLEDNVPHIFLILLFNYYLFLCVYLVSALDLYLLVKFYKDLIRESPYRWHFKANSFPLDSTPSLSFTFAHISSLILVCMYPGHQILENPRTGIKIWLTASSAGGY